MIDWKETADELAYIIYRLMEGDDVDAFETLHRYGYVDKDYEWLYEDDE